MFFEWKIDSGRSKPSWESDSLKIQTGEVSEFAWLPGCYQVSGFESNYMFEATWYLKSYCIHGEVIHKQSECSFLLSNRSWDPPKI